MDLTEDEILADHAKQSEQGAGVEPAPAPEDSFDPKGFGYTFRGETVFPKDRNELTELLQFGRSYRENKPKWEPILQGWERNQATYQGYEKLKESLQANPEFAERLKQLAQEYDGKQNPPAQTTNQPTPELAAIQEEMKAFKAWKQEQESRAADSDLTAELSKLEAKYGQYDWKADTGEGNLRHQLLSYMHKNQVMDPEIALRAMMYNTDVAKARFEAERKAADEAAKARKLGVVPAGTQGAPSQDPKPIDHRNLSYDDLEAMALEEISRR